MIWECANRRRAWVAALLLLSAAGVHAADPKVTGSLETVNGIRVLRLWGTPYEQGFAHGRLLAKDILDLFTTAITNPRTVPDYQTYENELRQRMLPRFRFTPEQRAELDGMYAGMKEALGQDGLRVIALGRDLDLLDLIALNTGADWYGMSCSSFSVWGALDAKGEILTARNLDFLEIPGLRRAHCLIVRLEPGEQRKRWVSVSWAGLIGAYTAMNEDGVTISMHDAPGRLPQHAGRFVPRSLALREAIERAWAQTAIDDVRSVLELSPSLRGNNVHVSTVFRGQATPAAVFEYDGDTLLDHGVTQRDPLDTKQQKAANCLICTNHFRRRTQPQRCNRYETLDATLGGLADSGEKVGYDAARRLMQTAAVDTTMHTVYFFPNQRVLYVGLAADGLNAAVVDPVRFALDDLLVKP